MRIKIALIICSLSLSRFSNSQNIETNFKNIDLKNLSADAFKMINYELALRKEKGIKNIREQKKFYLDELSKDTILINKYIQTYQEAFEKAKNSIIQGDVIKALKTQDVAKFGLDEVKSYQLYPDFRSVDSFLVTGIRLSITNYSKGTLTEVLNNPNKIAVFDAIAKKCIAYALQSKIVDAGKNIITEEEAKSIIQNIIPVDLIQKSFNNGMLVGEETVLKIQASLVALYPSIQKEFNSIAKNVPNKSELIKDFENVCETVSVDLRKEFRDLRKGLDTLVSNELKVVNTIAGFKRDIDERTKELNKIVDKSGQKYKELLTEVMVKSEIISGFMSNTLNVTSAIQNLQNGPVGYLINKDKRESLIQNLEQLKIPTLTGAIAGLGDLAGLLKGIPGAKQVEKYVGYAKQALNVGKSIVGLVSSFTPLGFVSAISGLGNLLGGLFGGGGPSKEEQMIDELRKDMMHEFEKVHAQLSIMDKKLDLIISKIDTLIAFAKTINENIVRGFEYQGNKLDYLAYIEETNFNLVKSLVFKDYNKCIELNEKSTGWEFKSVANLEAMHKARGIEIDKCLTSLFVDFSNPYNSWFFNEQNSIQSDDIKKQYSNWKNIISPSFSIFKDQYSTESDKNLLLKALLTLTFPVKETHASQYLLGETFKALEIDNSEKYVSDSILNSGLNSKLIVNYVENYLHFLPYYEFSEQPGDWRYSFLDYLKRAASNPEILTERKKKIIEDLQYFLKLTNSSLAQQSLYSGHLLLQRIHSILFKTGARNQENLDNAIKLLENNHLLATNFATFLINNSFYGPNSDSLRATFLEKYYACKADTSKCTSLNSFVEAEYPYLRFAFDSKFKMIELKIDKSITGIKEITLPVPDPIVVFQDKMLYTEGLYHLIDIKRRIINKLIDYTFTEYLPEREKEAQISSEHFKYLYPLSK